MGIRATYDLDNHLPSIYERYSYDGDTGRFRHLRTGRYLAPKERYSIHGEDKRQHKHSALRLAWAMYHGKAPPRDSVAIARDGDRSNAKIDNIDIIPIGTSLQRGCRAMDDTHFRGVLVMPAYINNPFRAQAGGIYLGAFDTPEAAARAYDDFARKRWGKAAKLNFPDTE